MAEEQQAPLQPFRRPAATVLAARLCEPRRFIQVVAGPRQVGKSTLVSRSASFLWVGTVLRWKRF